MSTKKTPALRSAWALMLVVPLAALVPPGRPPRTTKLDAATLARRRERREALKSLLTWPEEQRLGRECRRLAARGLRLQSTACYIRCSAACVERLAGRDAADQDQLTTLERLYRTFERC